MRIYDLTVRLIGGDNLILTEVNKTGVSAPELVVLRAIHGAPSIVNIKPTGQDKREHRKERERLKMLYEQNKDINIDRLFPAAMLPVEVDLGEPIEDERQAQRGNAEPDDRGIHPMTGPDRRQLRRHHQPPERHHRHRRVQHPERACAQHVGRGLRQAAICFGRPPIKPP